MKPKKNYCEECLEDIPNDEVYWEGTRLYCGRCGSEMDASGPSPDVFEEIITRRGGSFGLDDDDDGDDDLDEDEEERDYDVDASDEDDEEEI